MQHYQSLRDMGKQVKDLYEKLHLQHDLLRNKNPDIVHRQSVDNTALTKRISARLESISGWKYAPQPLKSLRNRSTGALRYLPQSKKLRHTSHLLATSNAQVAAEMYTVDSILARRGGGTMSLDYLRQALTYTPLLPNI